MISPLSLHTLPAGLTEALERLGAAVGSDHEARAILAGAEAALAALAWNRYATATTARSLRRQRGRALRRRHQRPR